jgi:hypothetical protein
MTIGGQDSGPLMLAASACARGRWRAGVASGLALFNVRLIHPPLVPGADLRMIADAGLVHGVQLAVSLAVQHSTLIQLMTSGQAFV